MKASLICTVLNEEKTIGNLLESVLKQTRKPDEIVIVDGGSRDDTVRVLKEHSKKFPIPVKVIVADGANISQGRNIAIEHAKWPVIVSTDGGTVHDRNWLKSIVRNIEDGCDVSSGMFYPLPKTKFEEIVGKLFYPDMDNVPDDWPPSSRSAAFTKKIWKKSGGYPEELYTAEDSIFNYRLKAIGARYRVARDAKSYWRPRSNFRKFVKQYFTYAKGNGESLLFLYHSPECIKFYQFLFISLIFIVLYLINYIWSLVYFLGSLAIIFSYTYKKLKDFRKALIGSGLIIGAAVANVLGDLYGLSRKVLRRVRVKKVKSIKIVK